VSDSDLGRIVQGAFPGSHITSCLTLDGGISSGAVAVAIVLDDGTERQVVVRRPNHATRAESQRIARTEHVVLTHCLEHGVAVPRACFVDLEAPAIVLDYVEGAPDFSPADLDLLCREMAEQLAAIHRVPLDEGLSLLHRRIDSVSRDLRDAPQTPDASLGETGIRTALNQLWPWPQRNADVLLHGDYWPGNLLWKDGRLMAVIDWEECERGDPLADLSVARLDVLWAYGVAAMEAFTHHYRERTGVDVENLARWDLCVALRPMSRLAHWASVYARPPILRPDVTEASMRAGHRSFIEQAVSSLRARGALS
jgi:aminoglycoside phosphotransferase (APT) family kinase protein